MRVDFDGLPEETKKEIRRLRHEAGKYRERARKAEAQVEILKELMKK